MKKAILSVWIIFGSLLPSLWSANPVTGRVLDERERPIPHAIVHIGALGDRKILFRTTAAGIFMAELDTGEYRIWITRKGYLSIAARTLIVHPGTNLLRYRLARSKRQDSNDPAQLALPQLHKPIQAHYDSDNKERIFEDVPDISQTLISRYGEMRTPGAQLSVSRGLVDSAARFEPSAFGVGGELSNQGLENLEVGEAEQATGLGNRFAAYSAAGPALDRETPGFNQSWHTDVSGLFASPQLEKGSIRLGDWMPRIVVSSPSGEHFWFSNAMSGEHGLFLVPELPKGQDATTHWQGKDALHGHFTLSSEHAIDFHAQGTYLNDANLGLSPFVPAYSTVDLHRKEGDLRVTDQYAFGETLLASGFDLEYILATPQALILKRSLVQPGKQRYLRPCAWLL